MKKTFQKWFPPFLMLVMALWFFGNLQPPKDRDFAFNQFAQLPITASGRIEPMDSLARNSLLAIREKQTLNTEPWKDWNQNPKIIPATEWLANVMMNSAVADDWPVFRFDNPDLISLLKLSDRDPAKKSDGKHYTWNQIQPMLDTFGKENERVQKVEAAARTPYENAVAKMAERLQLYASLRNTVEPAGAQNWPEQLDGFEKLIPEGILAAQAQQAGKAYDQTNFKVFAAFIQEFQFMAGMEPPLILPPDSKGQWRRMGEALLDAPHAKNPALDASIHDYAKMAAALAANQPGDFNAALGDLRSLLASSQPKAVAKARAELFFNQMEPFYSAMVIYVLAGLLACFFWFNLSDTLRRSSVWLLWLAFAIHTTGLIYRMVLEGRPPVTNLYSSAIFIGWGACLLGLILEKFHKNGIGAVVAAGMGFITLIIAHHLALEGDTMEMMRAVLDTNFWLATHVVAVTVGYASTFVAGFLALIYVLRGMFTKTLDETTGKSLSRMIYGIVCFATLFSFVGTVLGGIWADQSWGRFWGWDPKENGALIIVLWNALILHLRWGGIIRERGLVNCAIFGNVVTAWSWFGVNMLGIGLHSYGFTEAAFKWLVLFVASQLGFIALGLLPARMWKSFNARAGKTPSVKMTPKAAH
ncbi:MAG: cytochrome c biogenesis protein CcsA [Verrucomicrobiota bacterium]|jgi:ABC-type transport system involved in cytochrome c biogenesis permease subunit/predicted secreted protein